MSAKPAEARPAARRGRSSGAGRRAAAASRATKVRGRLRRDALTVATMLHDLAASLKELAGGSRHDGRSSRRPPSSRPSGPLRQTVSLASILLRYSLGFGLLWLACGMLAFSILWLLDLQETLLVVSAFFVLLSSLLSCHLFFYAKRDVFDRDVLRVIDYV